MRKLSLVLLASLAVSTVSMPSLAAEEAAPKHEPVTGYLQWRGPNQNGHMGNAATPAVIADEDGQAKPLWSIDLPGRGTPVIGEYADGNRMFVMGYTGQGADLLETLFCLDPVTGEEHWRRGYPDFLSDIIYDRYSISAPAIDPQTGHIYFLTSPGLLIAIDKDGQQLWRISMLETYGRLTFPNGRTGSPVIDGDRVIINAITSNWGREGPTRNRFYAFDKKDGRLIWSSDPGVGPPYLKDSSFSSPMLENRKAGAGVYRVFYAGLGDGNLVCVNALTGEPMWRYQMAVGGVNSTPVIYDGGTPGDPSDDLILQVHGQENTDDTGRGYMLAIKADAALHAADAAASDKRPIQITKDSEAFAWRNDDVSMFTSSPIIVDDTVYQCTSEGFLVNIDARNGQTRWKLKLGPDQLHASPIYASGNLYIPFWHNGLVIVPHTPASEEPPSFTEVKLDGLNIGSPALWQGRLYIHTTEKLYCFGSADDASDAGAEAVATTPSAEPGMQAKIRAMPAEVALRPGDATALDIVVLDAVGQPTAMQTRDMPTWEAWVPPTAAVVAKLDGTIADGVLTAGQSPSAGAFRATKAGLHAEVRGRVLPSPPYSEDFESFDLIALDANDQVHYAHPPLPWIGARLRWQVREAPGTGGRAGENQEGEDIERVGSGNKVLAKTLDSVIFQRSMVFMGHADDANYTLSADVMTDGNRRGMGVVGVINQRYLIVLDGNKQLLDVSSNHDRVKISTPFAFKPGTWYRLKTRVDVNEDGSGIVRAKAWPTDEDEPAAWTLSANVPHAHTEGSPGVYGFSPQSRHRVYLDNIVVEPNEE